ncbi:aldehyde dehydrogenase family-domain-containing protein [Choanephora cucurbitarum]|nr:aldehyde dehydrogenase family-domain-containing protein [Choanephora cucurbitarum]
MKIPSRVLRSTRASLTRYSTIKIGKKEGAKIAYGGKRWSEIKYYIELSVLINCRNKMRIMHGGIFGPVVATGTFRTIDEAIDLANDSDYGLAGGICIKNLDTTVIAANDEGQLLRCV